MARMVRVVVPCYPHQVTQRGNRRQRTFFADDDYATYRELLSEFGGRAGTAGVGVLPDAQSCAHGDGAFASVRTARGFAQGAPAPYSGRELSQGVAWIPVLEGFHSLPMGQAETRGACGGAVEVIACIEDALAQGTRCKLECSTLQISVYAYHDQDRGPRV